MNSLDKEVSLETEVRFTASSLLRVRAVGLGSARAGSSQMSGARPLTLRSTSGGRSLRLPARMVERWNGRH